jgi:hypothetical protein
MIRLPSRLILRLLDGSRPEKGVIDYYVILPIRIHDTFYKVPCLVTRLDPKHPVVLGMTFLNDEFPQYVELLRNIGKRESLAVLQTRPRFSARNSVSRFLEAARHFSGRLEVAR